jgi:hypothetical protein
MIKGVIGYCLVIGVSGLSPRIRSYCEFSNLNFLCFTRHLKIAIREGSRRFDLENKSHKFYLLLDMRVVLQMHLEPHSIGTNEGDLIGLHLNDRQLTSRFRSSDSILLNVDVLRLCSVLERSTVVNIVHSLSASIVTSFVAIDLIFILNPYNVPDRRLSCVVKDFDMFISSRPSK